MSPLFLVLGQESSDRRLTGAGRSRRPVLRNLLHGQWSAILYNYNVRNVNKKLSTPRNRVHRSSLDRWLETKVRIFWR